MIKRKTVRKMAVLLCVICCVFSSLSVPVLARAASGKLTEEDNTKEIGVYAKTERNIANEYTVEVKNKKAELAVDGNLTLKVSKIPSDAATLVVYYIPQTETEAWNWFKECLAGKDISAGPVHIMDVYFLDQSGSRINADGAEISVSCKHCGSIPMICSVDTDGNAEVLWSASGSKSQAAFTTNGSHYYIIAEKVTSDNGNNDNNNNDNNNNDNNNNGNNNNGNNNNDNNNNTPGDDTGNDNRPGDNNNNNNDNQQPDNKPDGNKPSNNKPDNKPDNKPNGGNQQEQKPDSGDKPYIEGRTEINGWDNIEDQLGTAKEKESVTVEMNGTTVVPGRVLDVIKGKDVTVVFELGGGITWTVNGKDITTDQVGDIDFGVTVGSQAGKTIPIDIINNVTGERYSMNLTLSYDGELGFTATLTLNVEKENAGLYANLFYYDPQKNSLEYICADRIDGEGNANLRFTHASDYVVVIDAEDMKEADTGSDEDIPSVSETENKDTPADADSTPAGNYLWLIVAGAIAVIAGLGIFFAVRKKKQEREE